VYRIGLRTGNCFFSNGFEMKFAIYSGSRRWPIIRIILVWLATISIATGNAIAQGVESNKILISGTTMGPIEYHVAVVNPPQGLDVDKLRTAVDESLEVVNRLMSTYLPESDVSRFNRLQSTDWFNVDARTANVVSRAIELSELSGGAFDITVGPAVDRWKFGANKTDGEFKLPTAEELDSLKAVVGYRAIAVRTNPPSLKKSKPGTSIDLSAIAKGYAVDVVGLTLKDLGCRDFMVEVGGEALVRGQRAGGGKWRIGVQKPDELSFEQAQEVLEITDCAIATSGDYRNYRAIGGKRYSHTIDPRTCAPVVNRVASVSVIAEDCMTADGVATALMVLGPDQGLELCQKMDLEALIKVRDEEFGDNFAEFKTAQFPVSVNDPTSGASAEDQVKPAGIFPVFIAAMIVFTLAVLAMATGAIFANKPIKGSCGGIASNGRVGSECGVCSKPFDQCPEQIADAAEESAAS
jgi:FAD:protein FMN transferase